ncbi:MAG: hypothetical protein ACI9CQ_004659, partial [Saprospiraceae bacterium]
QSASVGVFCDRGRVGKENFTPNLSSRLSRKRDT